MLEIVDVCKRYGTTVALDHVGLECPSGQTTALIGPSGCGKSTLLRLITGLVRPDHGEIRIAGVPLDARDLAPFRHRLGYVIQEGGLFPHLTALGNITLLARFLRWPGARIEERLHELLALVRLDAALLERFPSELSGGQRQRISLMRALMLDPDLLLLDEPLGALDPLIRYDLQQELKEIFRQLAKTVVLVTHDLAEAACFGNRLVLMRAGRIVQIGTYADLARQPVDPFVDRFIAAHSAPIRNLQASLS